MFDVFVKWIVIIAQIILIGLLLDAMKKLSCKILNNSGKYKVKSISAYIGTPIHEFGHFIFAILFGFKVEETQFFPTKVRDNGDGTVTLGYVKWNSRKYRITNSIGMLFVGIGPFISGTIVILFLSYLLEPELMVTIKNRVLEQDTGSDFFMYFYSTIKIIVNSVIEQKLISVNFIILIILTSMIAFHMNLSAPDIKVSLIGLAEVSFIIGIISIISSYSVFMQSAADNFINILSSVSSAVLSLCFICQCINLFISFLRSEM